MANTDHPNGFRFYRDLTSGDCPQVRHFDAVSGSGALELFRGQPVRLGTQASGSDEIGYLAPIDGTIGTDDDAAEATFVGICAAYVSSAVDVIVKDVPVILAHTAEFIVQDDGGGSTAITRATFHSHYRNDYWWQITNFASGSTTLGQSTAELAATTGADTAGYLKVTDWHRAPDNAFGDNMDLIVRFNPILYAAGPYAHYAPI